MVDQGSEGGANGPDPEGLWLDEGKSGRYSSKTARRAWLRRGSPPASR